MIRPTKDQLCEQLVLAADAIIGLRSAINVAIHREFYVRPEPSPWPIRIGFVYGFVAGCCVMVLL